MLGLDERFSATFDGRTLLLTLAKDKIQKPLSVVDLSAITVSYFYLITVEISCLFEAQVGIVLKTT